MAKILSAPGKTFLVGEYLALVGGPSVLVSTKPRFVLTAEFLQEGDESSSPFAPASPAGKFLARHERDFRGYRLHFDDPHQGAGGLGASSAQWALLYALKYGVHDQPDWAAMLEEYRQCAWNGEGVAPSGADVVSQIHGGITCFDGREFQARSLQWNFPNLSFTLVRTGVKLATHEHLKRHQAAPQEILRACVTEMISALETKNEELAVGAVARTAAALQESGRTAGHTLEILNKLHQEPWVRGAKGCGAMGADFVLVLHDLSATKSMTAWAAGQNLQICGGLSELDRGLRFEA